MTACTSFDMERMYAHAREQHLEIDTVDTVTAGELLWQAQAFKDDDHVFVAYYDSTTHHAL